MFTKSIAVATTILASVGVAAPTQAETRPPTIRIDAVTSPIHMFDVSNSEDLPPGTDIRPGVNAPGVVVNCTPGVMYYQDDALLTQDGVSVGTWWWGGLGQGEVNCPASGRFPLLDSFISPDLHPGKATVTYSIREFDEPWEQRDVVTRTVTIPRVKKGR